MNPQTSSNKGVKRHEVRASLPGNGIGIRNSISAAQQAKGSPSDIKYCNALGKAYSSMFPVMEGMPASDAVAMSRWASFDHTLNGAAA